MLAEAESGIRERGGSVARRRFPADWGKRRVRGTPCLGVEADEKEERAGDGAMVAVLGAEERLAELSAMTSLWEYSGVPARSSRAGSFLPPNEPDRERMGKSSGVAGMGRLAVEDVEGVLDPISSPSRMLPRACMESGVVSSPRRLDDRPAGAERCDTTEPREGACEIADAEDALDTELAVLIRQSFPLPGKDRGFCQDVGGADERGTFGSTPNSSKRLSGMWPL